MNNFVGSARLRLCGIPLAQCMAHTVGCKMFSAKPAAKSLLAIVLGICSLWQVWDLCLKFFGGSTTIAIAHRPNDYLPLPKFLLCQKDRYKKEELSSMGLPDNFLNSGDRFNHTHPFPDLNATWQRATWPLQELEIDWNFYEGMTIIHYLPNKGGILKSMPSKLALSNQKWDTVG